ncbi:amidohydrolase [Microlunatus soli]|uniref:Hippurate hydrolase n=1 Tax=Microlunatus soli TaxID=630515 RepID=A0A1H1UC21_9ACTN|nr:amidohydrolase [Microlunatus soli]SDS69831.1 hippurate hydrolase [Microlunatus soli]
MAQSSVLSGLDRVREWQADFYRDLHQHPELSHAEQRTAGKVADRLADLGWQVHRNVGGTGVVGLLANGDGPVVLLRADMDALPMREETGLPYASTVTGDADSSDENAEPATEQPVAHGCGHDMHVTCLLGAAALLADGRDSWAGTVVAVFQPAEETGDGASAMIEDRLASIIPQPDVAFAQHVLPFPAGQIATRTGPALSAADSMRITLHGRGGHGSMPQATVDPVVLAAMIIVRLQTVISRETSPAETAVLTVGSIQDGTKSNVIADQAVLQLNLRTYSERTRAKVLDAIRRIVIAECQASDCPRDPDFELFDRFPLTDNDAETTERVAAAFADFFGDSAGDLDQQTASEDFSDLPDAFDIPYSYWGVGCIDPEDYRTAVQSGRVDQDIPVNHSPSFAPVIQPTCDVGTQALVIATLAWLGTDR